MSLKALLEQKPTETLYTIKGSLRLPEQERFTATTTATIVLMPDAFLTLKVSDIDENYLFPLNALEDPEGGGQRHLIKIRENAEITLHYKTLKHTFKLNPNTEPPWEVDYETCTVKYLDKKSDSESAASLASGCYKYIIVYEYHCCGSGKYVGKGIGVVGCGQQRDDRCC